MLKKLQLIVLLTLWLSSGLLAQVVVLSDEFDNGDTKWNTGWIDAANATVAVSIDNTGKLSGTNSYKLVITKGSADTWRVQRNANCPLVAGNQYTLSFMAVADKNASINALFEISADPWTKRLNETAQVTTTPQTFTYVMSASENVPTNQVKLHFGGSANDNSTIWVDAITVTEMADPTLVSLWGKTSSGKAWPILNDTSTAAGNAGMGNDSAPTGWATMRGGFETLQATTTEAVVVSGKLQFVGGGGVDAYTHFRYGLTFQDSTTLNDALTDTATWVSTKGHYGYGFQPRTGNGTMANGRGGAGTLWLVDGGGFNSGWGGNNTAAVGINGNTVQINQQPRNAQMVEGTYNFAISVKMVDDTTSQIKWYLVEENNKYWYGGTEVVKSKTNKYNGICFGLNNDSKTTKFNVMSVRAELGDEITVPEAPWEAYYVDQWGKTSSGKAWPVLNDSTTLVGDAGMGDGNPPTGWATIRGGFGQDLPLKTDKELIVSGQLEFVGGGGVDAYTHFRYGMTYQDSSTLKGALTDTANWVSTKGHYGYGFQPRTGNGTMANGRGGAGTLWLVDGGGFNSGWGGNNTAAVGINGNTVQINQQPRNAQMIEGTYDFAVSVKMIDDTTSQVKWYLVEENNKYWYGGTEVVKSKTNKYNGICFGLNNDSKTTQFNIIEAKVDYGTITVPEAPWEAYYVDQWGKTSSGKAWPVLNDSTTLVGDAGMGDGNPPTGWATIRGGFGQDLPLKTDKELIVSGQLEFVGGGGVDAYTHFRYGMTYQDSSTLKGALTDTANWVSTKGHYGYGFQPRTGTGVMANGRGGAGTLWLVDGGGFNSGWGGNNTAAVGVNGNTVQINQQPRNAQMIEGTYDFAVSVKMIDDTTSQVKWYLVEENNKYWYGGTEVVKSKTNKYNGICFGLNNDSKTTQFNIIEAKVDYGTIVVPDAPFEPFFVGDWGFLGSNRIGGWILTPGEFTGNVSIGGTAPSTGWSAIRGSFGEYYKPTTSKALKVTGKMELVGGGFEAWSSLRLGLFASDSAGTLTDSIWSGNESSASGYLFLPHSGTNDLTNWQGISQLGSVGAVVNGAWISSNGASNYVLGTKRQKPNGAVAGAGTYNFEFSIGPVKEDGSTEVRYYIYTDNKSYSFGGVLPDTHDPLVTDKFNSFNIALNTNASTTALNLIDVYVDMGDPIVIPDSIVSVESLDNGIPTEYALDQNYPNPFNPSTTIRFALPQTGNVSLVVYDVLGRVVTKLVDENLNAGYHQVNFNASNLASGIYFYRITAGDFVTVKKLMLLK